MRFFGLESTFLQNWREEPKTLFVDSRSFMASFRSPWPWNLQQKHWTSGTHPSPQTHSLGDPFLWFQCFQSESCIFSTQQRLDIWTYPHTHTHTHKCAYRQRLKLLEPFLGSIWFSQDSPLLGPSWVRHFLSGKTSGKPQPHPRWRFSCAVPGQTLDYLLLDS